MGKLERLSPEQEALMSVVRDEWLAHGLATEPADREVAERGVANAYRVAGLEPPSIVVWLDSPLAGALGQALLRLPQVRDQVGDQVWGQVWDQVGGQVRDQVGDQVWGQVRDQVGDQVWGQVWGQVGGQVRDQVGDQVGDQVWGQVRDQVGDQVWGQVWGQVWDWLNGVLFSHHEAGFYAFYEVFRQCGISGPERLEGQMAVAKSAGWWWPLEGAVVLTARPVALSRDDQGRLHHESGMAIAYPDGWGLWSWHGQRVPQWVIEDPTPEAIAAESNIEIRRCAIESYGWERYVADWTPVDTCDDPGNAPHSLALYDVPRDLWGDDARVLVCTNGTPEPDGTPRRYGLVVPSHMTRAIQAAASSYRLTEAEYATLGRRS